MDIRLTKEKFKAGWEYGGVRMVLVFIVVIALFYALFQMTRPVVPAGERFDILHGGIYLEEGEKLWSMQMLDGVVEGQKEINFEGMGLDDYSEYNASMVMISRVTSQEGDIFIIPYALYQSVARSDTLVNLEEPIEALDGRSILESITLPPEIGFEECRITVTTTQTDGSETTAREACGLNMTQALGLVEIGIVPTDYVLCVPDYKNVDYKNVVRVIQWIVDEKIDYEDPVIAIATTPAAEAK